VVQLPTNVASCIQGALASRCERTLPARCLNSAGFPLETTTLPFDLHFRASLHSLGVRPLIAALRDAARRCKLYVTTGRGGEHCGRWLPSVLRVLPGVGAGHGAGAASTVALVLHPTSFLFSSLLPFCPVCRRRISTSSVATAVILLASIAGLLFRQGRHPAIINPPLER